MVSANSELASLFEPTPVILNQLAIKSPTKSHGKDNYSLVLWSIFKILFVHLVSSNICLYNNPKPTQQ